ncbi:ProQ/FINO family protein [Billgrantia ethanolica]|nr:ProQ/FINO family protein [Halomonas ethanolica]
MIEERSRQLFDVLETCADTALHELRSYRARIQELESRLADSDVRQQELEAARLELMEENRELDEQNRELEEDNARLRERLRKGETTPAFPGPARRAQGLAALIGQRPRAEAAQQSEPAEAEQEAAGKTEAASKPLNPFAPAGGVSAASSTPAYASFKAAPAQKSLAERQGQLAIEQAPSADALLKQWYRRYPHAFFKGHTRPLKVGIHLDLAAREPWPEKLVRRALAGYVNLPRYLKAVREGAERIDLDGAPAGDVDAQAAEHAKRKLERLQNERRERSRPAGAAPKRGSGSGRSRAVAAGAQPGDKAPRQTHENAPPKAAGPISEAADPISATADPEERMEAKLSALLAKHGSSRKGS